MTSESDPGDTLQPHMHMAEACRLIWREQLEMMAASEAGVRVGDDIEYVHNMRVAVRRARVAARLFNTYFRRRDIRRYVEGLRTTGRMLGAVRDLDVALYRARQLRRRKEGRPTQVLLVEWERRRRDAHQSLTKWLDSEEYKVFFSQFSQFCSTPTRNVVAVPDQPGASAIPQHVNTVIPAMIVDRYTTIRSYTYIFEAGSGDADLDYATLHTLRIDCKYLRYTLEFARHLLGPDGDALIAKLKKLQDDLGDLHDAVVSRGLIQQVSDRKERDVAYLHTQDMLIAQLSSAVPGLLREFSDPATRCQLGNVIALL